MSKTRKRTPKERVLARYPVAYIVPTFGMTEYLCLPGIGRGKTPDAAWADAARRLSRRLR